jgi:FtsP/CotA-like multicopper oxidase with cupredoxin domain
MSEERDTVSERSIPTTFTRADLLKLGGLGAAGLLAGGAWAATARGGASSRLRAAAPTRTAAPAAVKNLHLAATDGYIALPGRPAYPDADVYVFGFVRVANNVTPDQLDQFKGHVQVPAPIIAVDEEDDFYLTMTNIGLVVRPDLDDSHTIHWHGFPNATAIFDGVPEVSISVPVGRDFPYFYKPHRAGSFMYHCHFEDVEHVQMSMQGSVFVRPAGFPSRAYADAATAFDRQFAVHLNEVWTTPHDNLEAIQETVWPDYKANYWTINGRCYPDTIKPNNDASLPFQPLSSLIQVNALEDVLLRFSNLGYEQQAMQLPGIRMKVVGEDAAFLRNSSGLGDVDLSYETNTIYVGPGEARDAIVTAPAFDSSSFEVDADAGGREYNRYWLRNRNVHRLTNDGYAGLGGQVTEFRVYNPAGPGGPLPAQSHPNETFPEPDPPSSPAPYMDPWFV